MTKTNVGIVLLAVFSFAASYAETLMTRSQATHPTSGPTRSPITERLALTAEQEETIREHDPDFPAELSQLRDELRVARDNLIATFEKSKITDEDLRRQIESVIEAHNRLERRVANHLIAVRRHINPAQQKMLFDLCADCVRACQRPCQCRLRELMGEPSHLNGVQGHQPD